MLHVVTLGTKMYQAKKDQHYTNCKEDESDFKQQLVEDRGLSGAKNKREKPQGTSCVDISN